MVKPSCPEMSPWLGFAEPCHARRGAGVARGAGVTPLGSAGGGSCLSVRCCGPIAHLPQAPSALEKTECCCLHENLTSERRRGLSVVPALAHDQGLPAASV